MRQKDKRTEPLACKGQLFMIAETRGKDGLKGQRMGGGEQKTPNLLFSVDVKWQQDSWTWAFG